MLICPRSQTHIHSSCKKLTVSWKKKILKNVQLFSKTSEHHPSLCKPNLYHRVKREDRQHAGGPSPSHIYGNHNQLITFLTQFQTLLNRALKAITYLWGLEDKKKHVGHSGYQFWKLLLLYLYYSIILIFYIHVSY